MTSFLTPVLLLRIASGLTLLFAAGHAMGAMDSWSPPGDTDVLRSMRAFEFDVTSAIPRVKVRDFIFTSYVQR